ncbi:SMEK domain-containing protein [Agrobacterium sp. B1(2019)]|uniref:SMEK domain-containing protein n=1 Tax=Agrobacterium sp. B1(2019) TaxID=2607032 RepID=UPI0011EE3020|nr:SMEK domain-containing protein [Agrobacterium sp. B1(2019)]TZG32400.1 SMEK domain-containing protein [Agrobacterium sp. B1(2019)]
MITRGHLIGQVVDDLTGIAAQAKQRANLHLFDLNTYIEDFAKEVLNRVLDLGLINLNSETANNPGLDLGDLKKGWAFQITGDKSLKKVKYTLEKIDAAQRAKYPHIRILVIGEKQGSYTLTGEPYASFAFTEDMIWDFDDVCSRLMSMPIDTLKDLADYVSRETRRVRIELEIPDDEGVFPTSIDKLVEALPKPQLTDAARINAYIDSENIFLDDDVALAVITEMSRRLSLLPRLTREVFKLLIERRDDRMSHDVFRISEPKLRRIYQGGDLDGDLALLVDAGLIDWNEPDDYGRPPYYRILLPGDDGFCSVFVDFAREKGIDLRKPLVTLDFSDF